LNRLQNLKTDQNIFVSLNPHTKPADNLTHHRVIMGHPQFNPSTLDARRTIMETHQGQHGIWFCGAWTGYGFHEDGCRSGFDVATKLSGTPLPWTNSGKIVSTLSNENNDPTKSQVAVLSPPDLSLMNHRSGGRIGQWIRYFHKAITYHVPVAICKRFLYYFLQQAVQKGTLRIKYNDGTIHSFGDSTPCGCDSSPVTLRVFDPWFFVKTALEYDLGLARSYMSGLFVVEQLDDVHEYHPVLRPPTSRNETTPVIGDPIGLTRLFLLLIGNRDSKHVPKKSAKGFAYSNAFSNASGLIVGKLGSFINYMRYKLTMDNSERGGSLRNIHSHYDLSNDLFTTFLDKETLMYSSAIYDAISAPSPQKGLLFRGTLEEAQWRKLDTLLVRAQIQPGQTMLDIGFGWGGLSIHAAKKFGCKVTGITLSVEQKALAETRVRAEGLESLINFEVVDYRTFARRKENHGKFDRVLSCEMIEAVGHSHLGEFFWAVEQVLAADGVLVMEAITTPEVRYENYIRSTDFINTIIFPGSCCPSLHALVDAAYQQSSLTLEHIDNIGLHYAQTLAEWRRRFNESETVVRSMGFDDIFLRAWNYYLTYCEAGFFSQTENCLILVFSRQGCQSLVPLCETRSVTQATSLTAAETSSWVTDAIV
jgi:cyclopropane-fatty-acyl-phospholipid synthase